MTRSRRWGSKKPATPPEQNAPRLSSTSRTSGLQLPDRLLVIVLNDREKAAPVVVRSDLSLWLPSAASYKVVSYDGHGKQLGEGTAASPQRWSANTAQLEPGEMAFFEISTGPAAVKPH